MKMDITEKLDKQFDMFYEETGIWPAGRSSPASIAAENTNQYSIRILAFDYWSKNSKKLKDLQTSHDALLEACKNIVRGQLQHPTFRSYVNHAVWVAGQAIEEAEK